MGKGTNKTQERCLKETSTEIKRFSNRITNQNRKNRSQNKRPKRWKIVFTNKIRNIKIKQGKHQVFQQLTNRSPGKQMIENKLSKK